MRDPVSLPLLPRSNLQRQSLRREDEADPGSNHKSVSYRYVEPQIYSIIGMYVITLQVKDSWSRGGGLCCVLLPGEVVQRRREGLRRVPRRGDPGARERRGAACPWLSRGAFSGLSLLCRERAGAFQCKWGTWSSAAPTNQRSLGHFELILKLRKRGAWNGALLSPSCLSPCNVSICGVCACVGSHRGLLPPPILTSPAPHCPWILGLGERRV